MRRSLLLIPTFALVLIAGLAAGPIGASNDPGFDLQWSLGRTVAEPAWSVGTGKDVIVAVIDTGVDLDHEDLTGKLVAGFDFVDDDDIAEDENGHGTHVAGVVAANVGNGIGVAGMAPDAKIMPLRALDSDGGGDLDDVVAAIRFAVANGADVINLSLGQDDGDVLGPAFVDAVREAFAAGVIPVIAANDFVTGSEFADEPAVVVSATTREDASPTTYESEVGEAKWGLAAPGGELPAIAGQDAGVLSTFWVAGKGNNQYAYLAGTSTAAPHVSGALAVLLGLGLEPQAAIDKLMATADDLGDPGRDATFGAGRMNLDRAVEGMAPSAPDAPTATTTTAPGTSPSTTTRPGASTSDTTDPDAFANPLGGDDDDDDELTTFDDEDDEGDDTGDVALDGGGDNPAASANRTLPALLAGLAIALAGAASVFTGARLRPGAGTG